MKTFVSSFILIAIFAAPVFAQSPNTATLLVVVVDPTGAVVPDAKVSVDFEFHSEERSDGKPRKNDRQDQ